MAITTVITAAVIAVAAIGWLLSAVSAIAMLRHRDRSRSVAWFLVRGDAYFTGDGFLPSAKPWQQRFLAGVALFAIALIGIVVQAAAFG